MMRKVGLSFLAVCLIGSSAWAAKPKNIVMMVADDQGLQAGCYGDPVVQTPNLDRLATEGTRFSSAYCTTSSCSASRSVILTGLVNHTNGQYGHMHAKHHFFSFEWVRSLPVLLGEAGYRTVCVGKHHVQPEANYHFERYIKGGKTGGSRSSIEMAEMAEAFIKEKDDRPFFVYFCPTDPHRNSRGGYGNEADYPGEQKVVYDPKIIPVPDWLPDQPEVRADLAEYYQSISRLDQGLGRLLEALKNTGHGEDTLILYLSDNGPPFPGAKTTVYEPGIHLPLVVRHPDQKRRGLTCNALVTFADLTPTLLEYAGVKGPKYPLAGRSFLYILEQEKPASWDEMYASHTFHGICEYYPMRVVRIGSHKLILNLACELPYPFASDLFASPTWQGVLKRGDTYYGKRTVQAYIHRPHWELYDLAKDPDEIVNRAGDPAYAEVLAKLQAKLKAWQEKTGDPWMKKYEYE